MPEYKNLQPEDSTKLLSIIDNLLDYIPYSIDDLISDLMAVAEWREHGQDSDLREILWVEGDYPITSRWVKLLSYNLWNDCEWGYKNDEGEYIYE